MGMNKQYTDERLDRLAGDIRDEAASRRGEISRLEKQISQQRTWTDERIDRLRTTTNERIDFLRDTVNESIDRLRESTSERITQLWQRRS
jgi:DNA anti-recombination protein RmuC